MTFAAAMTPIEILRALVSFDTTSRNSNLALIDWVVPLLEAAGARLRLTRDDTGRKANILASFGPDLPGGIVLSGHTDVVPVDGQDWTSDPFTLTERNGRLYGRGTADMKSFIACCLAAIPGWTSTELKRPIHLALTYDEEIGCFGAMRLVDDLVAYVPKPALAIVGEPTSMRIGDRHRGFFGFRTTFRGRPAHSSNPALGVSAVVAAAEFVCFLETLQVRHADGTEATTFNIGRINGGTAINIVPGSCELVWEYRPAADADLPALDAMLDDFLTRRDAPRQTEPVIAIPPLRPDPHNPAIALAACCGAHTPPVGLAFGSEAGFFQKAGIATVICGPGSIEQAHQPDEWIEPGQLDAASALLAAIGRWAAGD